MLLVETISDARGGIFQATGELMEEIIYNLR